MYRTIDFEKIYSTLSRLFSRIEERFSNSGLVSVCGELQVVAGETEAHLQLISKPNYWLRGSVALIIILLVSLIIFSIIRVDTSVAHFTFSEIVQVGESLVNDLVLFSLAIFFLTTFESRIKRAKAIKALNELRAIAHIIDMHQLTKDPTEIGENSRKTASSPERAFSPYKLKRYLDYCSEMLAIIGKIAAVYAQYIPEKTVVSSVNEIETLTSGISQKIWQKIMILQQTGL